MSIRYIIGLIFAASLSACEDGKPIVVSVNAYPSPDGAYVATLEVVDNGLGFGQGALYEEIHVTRKDEPVGAHGDPGQSVVFYAESTYKAGDEVKLAWVESKRLHVEYETQQHPGRASRTHEGISIDYAERGPR